MASDWQVVSPTDNSWQEVKPQQPATPASSAMEKTGLYNVPVLGGVMRSLISPETGFIDTVSQKAQDIQQQAQTDPKAAGKMAQQAGVTSGNPILDLIQNKGFSRAAAPSALTLSAGADLPELATGVIGAVKNLPKVFSLLTTKGAIAAQKTGAGRGADMLISDIEKEANRIAGDKQPKEVIDEINKVISRMRGNKLEVTGEGLKPSLTTQDVLDWRKQLDSELPKTFWEQIGSGGNQAKNKAIGIARTALTNLLHESAPGTVVPDKLLGTYANIGGDIPSILKKLGVGLAIDRASKAVGGPQAEAGVDILTILKMLGKI